MRSAGPFAVVIEEACEVIEPTLMSVLAVNTLRKLEMIGDHRQLPAFVQQCWFHFETTIPSIKTSLFERLIIGSVKSPHNRDGATRSSNHNAEAAAILPHTVLDEQRRMRSSIAEGGILNKNKKTAAIFACNTGLLESINKVKSHF